MAREITSPKRDSSGTRRRAPKRPPSVQLSVNAERVAWVGPTPNRSSAPVRQCGFRKAVLLSKDDGCLSGRAPPGSHVDHACVGPPPFSGTETCTTEGGRRGGKFPSVPGLGAGLGRRTHGTDGAQVAQLRVDHAVHLLG